MNFNLVTKKPSSFILNIIIFIAVLSYANIIWAGNVFIDPTASSGGNGSFAAPYNSWGSVKFSSSNDYYQKCGTVANLNFNISVYASGTKTNKIIIGPYYNDGGTPALRLSSAHAKPIIDRGTYSEGSVFTLNGDHINLVNLELRGGESTIRIKGAECIVEYCVIGEKAKWGIRVAGVNALNAIIRYNIIDAKEGVYDHNSVDGISMTNGSRYTSVYRNVFGAWDHTALEFENSDYNEVYDNTAINPDGVNTRFFAIDLGSDYNKIHNNWIADMSCRSQFGAGVHNEAYKNIFFRVTNDSEDEGSAVWFQGIAGGVSKYNKFYNNIIYDVQKQAVAFYNNSVDGDVQYNEVYKNVILNTGLEGTPIVWVDKNTNGILNQTISDNYIFNENGANEIKHRGTIYTTSTYNSINSYDVIDNNRWEDPKFKDAANGNFAFQQGSPLFAAGIEEIKVQILSQNELLNAGVSQLLPLPSQLLPPPSQLLPPTLKIAQQK